MAGIAIMLVLLAMFSVIHGFTKTSNISTIEIKKLPDGYYRKISKDDVITLQRKGPAIVMTVEGSPTAMMYDTASGGYKVVYMDNSTFVDFPANRTELKKDVIAYYNDNIAKF